MSAHSSLQCAIYPQVVDLIPQFRGKILDTVDTPVVARHRLNAKRKQRLRLCGREVSQGHMAIMSKNRPCGTGTGSLVPLSQSSCMMRPEERVSHEC